MFSACSDSSIETQLVGSWVREEIVVENWWQPHSFSGIDNIELFSDGTGIFGSMPILSWRVEDERIMFTFSGDSLVTYFLLEDDTLSLAHNRGNDFSVYVRR